MAKQALRSIRDKSPEMMVGVGTIFLPQQVCEVKEAGASFGVSPGMNPRVSERSCARWLAGCSWRLHSYRH